MNVEFEKASNNELTCKYNTIKLHSYYNPSREAQNFISSLQIDFEPPAVIITGPCISYTYHALRQRFPKAQLYAIQFTKDFLETDSLWKKTFYIEDTTPESLAQNLFNTIGDENLISTLCISWQPSQKAFPEKNEYCWNEIKAAILKSKSVLLTRSFFSKRWIKNSLRYFTFLNKTVEINKIEKPVLICASGPSLKSSISKIIENKNNFFIICVSSALSVLLKNNIIPDLIVSTDGGFWAKIHLSHSLKKFPDIPVAIPDEAAVYASIIKTNPILPLIYEDSLTKNIYKALNIKTFTAERNGTVSGTAAKLAIALTDKNIFFTGLDLCEGTGYAHTAPNEIELYNSQKDTKLNNLETRIFPQSLKNPSLEIYKNWFSHHNFNNRLFRLSNNFKYKNNLINVKDVNWDFAENYIKTFKTSQKEFYFKFQNLNLNKKIISTTLYNEIKNISNTQHWQNESFPVEYIMYQRYKNTDKALLYQNEINTKNENFLKELKKYF